MKYQSQDMDEKRIESNWTLPNNVSSQRMLKAKSKGFDLEGIYLNIEKLMTQNSERKIKELIIDIFIPVSTSSETIDFLKQASKECPVTRNLSQEIDIKISWHNK